MAVVRRRVSGSPPLVPIYGNRYISNEPLLAGNPVLSVWQTDIIYYGYDLASYFNELRFTDKKAVTVCNSLNGATSPPQSRASMGCAAILTVAVRSLDP